MGRRPSACRAAAPGETEVVDLSAENDRPHRRRASASGKRVLLVGWDGADWDVIHPLMDGGSMPNLARFVEEGVMGNLATLRPDLSPMLWTSIATGKRPFKHGVCGFVEPDPHRGGIRPITSLSRRTKALWNILSQCGIKSNIVGWWPSHPAEPIDGVMVSNHYPRATGPADRSWPMQPGTVHPERLVRNLADLRWHPQRLDPAHVLPFVPRAAEIDLQKDRRLDAVARTYCECLSIQVAALALMHHEPWDFTAVYFDGIDHFCHGFMRYHPPREDWVPEKDFELFRNVVSAAYQLHDAMLGALLDQAGRDATVILVSDHGFKTGRLRPRFLPQEPAGPAAQHRHCGVLAMRGEGIRKDERVYGASLLDICPTILTVFGLPVGGDMDGKPLVAAFEKRPAPEIVPSWDEVPGPSGMHPTGMRLDPGEARQAVRQLVDLGYIEEPDADREKAGTDSERELDYNLARSYMDAGRHAEAASILWRLFEAWPEHHRFGVQLATCLQTLRRLKDSRQVLERLIARKEKGAAEATLKLELFHEKHGERRPEDFSAAEAREFHELRARASRNPFAVEYLMGAQHFAEGDDAGALRHFKRAAAADSDRPDLCLRLGEVYRRMKRLAEAEGCFDKALDLDPDNAQAHLGLCRVHLSRRRNMDAAEAAMAAVGLVYHSPMGHFLLGVALDRLGDFRRAAEALKVALSQNPNFPEAHRRLARIYQRRLRDPARAEEHLRLAAEAAQRLRQLRRRPDHPAGAEYAMLRREGPDALEPTSPGNTRKGSRFAPMRADEFPETIIVVSGLPRSGTSMMMQMLEAGGVPALADGKRPADADNPKGYFEVEAARQLWRDGSWLAEAKGRAVKIVAPLLRYLPAPFSYRVIFMERDLSEVVASQREMLKRRGKRGADLSDDRLPQVFTRQVNAVKRELAARGVPTLFQNYGECVERPAEAAAGVNAFLGGLLDEAAMAKAVDACLHRRRAGRV